MNVFIIAWKIFPYYVGGIEIHTYELAKNLAKMGVNVTLITSRPRYLSADNVKNLESTFLENLNIDIHVINTCDIPKIKVIWDALLFTKKVLFFSNEKINIIHLQSWNLTSTSAILLKYISNIPLVVTSHGSEFSKKSDAITEFFRKRTLHSVDNLIAVSKYQKNIVYNNYPHCFNDIEVITNGVNLPLNHEYKKQGKSSKYIVAFIGRLVPSKGPSIFLEMAKIIIQKRKDVEFWIIGDGPEKNLLTSYVIENKISDYIIFYGSKIGSEKDLLLENIDILVAPLLSGIVLLEGMSYGIPIVACDINWTKEVINDGFNGLLTTADPVDIANKVLILIESNHMRHYIGLNALNTIKNNYTWDIIAEKTLKYYEKILDDFV